MTSPTDKQPVTKELTEELKIVSSNYDKPIPIEAFEKRLLELAYGCGHLAIQNRDVFISKDSLSEHLKLRGRAQSTAGMSYSQLKNLYSNSFSEFEQYRDIVLQSRRSETRAHLKNLLFRILTTLGVGLSIMGIYALAHWFKIPMPLMKLPAIPAV